VYAKPFDQENGPICRFVELMASIASAARIASDILVAVLVRLFLEILGLKEVQPADDAGRHSFAVEALPEQNRLSSWMRYGLTVDA
jgi:hypothetical protein